MFEKYMDDYYKGKKSVKEICTLADFTPTTFHRWLKKNNLTPYRKYWSTIDTGVDGLNQVLKDRYGSIINRCNGMTTDYYGRYKGKPYMPIYEYVEFCNAQKEHLKELWKVFIRNGRDSKYAISVDRIDNKGGYTVGNIQFTTHGFNSWKRVVNPIKVTHDREVFFFSTLEEGSLYFGLRRQALGEVFNRNEYHAEGYEVEKCEIKDVLKYKNVKTLEEYYNLIH